MHYEKLNKLFYFLTGIIIKLIFSASQEMKLEAKLKNKDIILVL